MSDPATTGQVSAMLPHVFCVRLGGTRVVELALLRLRSKGKNNVPLGLPLNAFQVAYIP